jgi:glycosyltransferase involved in cell wall biosynthesis
MRVLLDTTFARRGPSGTGVYLERLVPALRAAGVEVEEAANERRRPPAGGGLGSAANALEDLRWTAVELPRLARSAGADLIHHPLPALVPRGGIPQVLTVHDLAFLRLPERFDPRYRAHAERAHRAAARRAAAVVCVSETTARDVRARWGVAAARIVVARHGAGQEPAAPAERAERHFLYVGDDEPRKNLATLLTAYARYRDRAADPAPLVLAGTLRGQVLHSRIDGVELVQRPDAARLAELYGGALALVHPALHEGFGLTPLEAMSAGVPVIAARSPGLVEVCGEAVRYADPRDAESFAAALAGVAGDPAARRDLAALGRRRAAEFSWTRSARDHIRAYTLALHP